MPHRRRKHHAGSTPAPVLVVTGLTREAQCVGREGVETICSGANASFLRAALREKARFQYSGVVSFGIAGGLCPTLRPGDAVLGTQAIGSAGSIETHFEFNEHLRRGFRSGGVHAQMGAVAGVDAPAMTVAHKTELRETLSAIAVDMESHIAGAFARSLGLPFAIVRVACDPAERALPPLAAKAIKRDGGVDLPLVLRELSRQPEQLRHLIRAGVDSGAAFATLRRCGRLLRPLFGLMGA
jgi:adenosylhomocysteine nucleosidase